MQEEVIEGYRLSPQQEYVWLLCQQDGAAQRTHCALRLEGELHKSFLKEALQQVVEQHEILRTAFRSIPGMNLPLQVILEHGAWSWREVDLRQFAEAEQSSQLAALEWSESARAFNHEQGEVLYACLVILAPERHVLLINISPLCADAWSLQNLVRELGRRYMALLSGAEVALEAVQYADFSEWQHKLLNTEESAGRDFWRKQNVSNMPVLKLPLEKDASENYRPEYISLKSDAELVHELEVLARAYDVSLSELLLAAWSSLLWRLTGERELVIGAAVDGGRYKELQESLGLFTKYLPVPLRFAAGSSFQEIIRRVAASYRDACRRQEYYTPGEGHAAEEGMGYEYEDREETVAGYGPLRVAVLSVESCRSRQRVLLQCRYQRATKRLELRLRYDAGCYSPEMIKLVAERLETWLQSVVRAPRAELSKVRLLGEGERGLLRDWSTGAALEGAEACETLGEMLEQQARQQGETAAVVGVDEVLTFSELNARANQLGRYLRQRGVGPEAVVGILLERSSRMVECVCGVWKAGGAYMPLHPGTPPARLKQVLKQAGVRLVVSERELAELVVGAGVEVLEWEAVCQEVSAEEASEPEVAGSGANLAYVIYTSGSTGEPKGVMIEQRSVLHLLGGLRQEVYGANDERCARVGLNAPLSFDASVKQLVQVLRGKALVMIPEELRLEAGPLLSYLAEREVDVLDCTPAQLRLLRADAAEVKWPRLLLVGGEAIDSELWQQLGNWSETDSINLYGPTEATVDTTWKCITGPGATIGRPLPQVRVYLLDQHGEQVAIGQVGEVYIGGSGVARGYLHEAGLTAERFVPDGYGEERGGRLYRTGDLARYTEDGELEYVGRTDRQVKLRGFRIELEEVEAALLEHEGVKAAAAMVRREAEEKEERLVAYVVPRRQQAAIIEGQGFSVVAEQDDALSEAEHPLHTAKLGEQVVGGSALYQLPNKLEVFHHNRNETEHLYHQIFENQFYLKHGISIKPGDCIFDVGANIGLFTLFVYHQVRNASVYSFEPIPSNFEKLRNNVALYGLDANLFNCGLSDREGTATFTFYPNWSACSGVYANVEEEEEALKTFLINQGELVAEYADELIEGRYKGEQVVCQLRTLSEVIRQHNIERIDLLKLDVEKSEWDVLEGIEPEDWQKIRQVVVEVHDLDGRLERMQQLLAEQGFVVEVEQEVGLVGTNIHSLYARRIEAAAELSEMRNGNGTARWWRESLARGAEAEVSEAELQSYLRERLPEYMVPQVLVKLERMPLSRHGKIDYQRLPAPAPREGELKGEAARSEVEKLLAGIWSEVLGLARVGREENFFELGGHSLLATQVISRVREVFGVEMRLRELFERPTVKELGQSIERELRQGTGVSAPPIQRRELVEELPLSFAQQRLWFIDQLEPGGAVYNVPVAVRLQGSLNKEALAQTLTEVVRRHEVLRTRFDTVAGRVVQVIEAAVPVELEVVELSALKIEEREARMREWAAQEAATPFDLSRGPLRVKLLRLAEQEHVVLLTMHHIVSDGWSVGVLIKEVGALYAAYAAGQESPLPELPIQYADFALWQRAYLQGEVLDQQLGYWRRQLSDAPRLLHLPSDHPRPAVRTFHGDVERFELDQELSEKLRALSRRESVTLFMLLLAVFKILLMKYAGQADIVIGADVANRNRAETENLIGFFVNMLVLRTDLSGNPAFTELLQRVREVCLEAYAHQDLPFEKLVEELQPERSLSYAPLFQVVFALQNAPAQDLNLPELTLSTVGTEIATAKFDLVFNLLESDQQLVGSMEYSTDLFEAASIKRLLGHYQRLLAAVVADPAQQLATLPLLTEAEEQQLAAWNQTTREYPRDACIHQLFEAQVERTPEAVAVSFKAQRLSYRELNQRANQLAHHLQKLGLEPGARVGLYLAHSPETLVAILGVLKAGAAYVPIDPDHPIGRLHFILEDAEIAVLLTETGLAERVATLPDTRLLCLDSDWEAIASESGQNPAPRASAADLAYVIYTSGSTGTPKGVKIQQRALVNYIWWAKDVYVQDEQLDFPLYSSLAFDLTVTSIFTPLLTGNRVVVYRPDGWQSPLTEILKDDQVGVLKLTPSHLALLKDGDNSQSHIKRLIVGGEAFKSELARQVYESFGGQVEIYNEYGPTEATVGCMIYRFNPAQVELASVPIGRPAANVQIYILDEQLSPVPENVVGEVYIAGDGLAAGYLNRADLTAESFICNPFLPAQRMYRTKDLARRLPDQEIEYVGRQDEQVKFHGYRVELNEIRSVLNSYRGVRDSVVLVRKKPGHGNDLMIAYYAARQEIEARVLRDFLAQSLIKETIPNVFVHLKKLPLTLNGKVNLKALPDLEETRLATKHQYQGTRTPIEAALATIWEEILSVRQIGLDANFFELGGHSLLATQVISRVRAVFGVEVGLRELFERPTVKELGQRIERELRQGAGVSTPPIERRERVGELPLSFAQQRLWFIDQLAPGGTVYNIPLAVRLSGALNVLALEQTLNEIIRRHEVLRTFFAVVDEQPVQVIAPEVSLSLSVQELTSAPEAEREAEVLRLVEAEAQQPFDLGQGPLLRVKLWRLSESEHVVLLTMHHIITDGWSLGLLISEVAELYRAFAAGEPSPLPELPVQYADFALWQRERLQGEELERQLSYWRQQLAETPALLELPTDRPRPPLQTFNGAHETFTLSTETTQALQRLSRSKDVTLFMMLLAVWQVLLHRYSGQKDVVVGTSIANRNRAETERLIGFFVNMLVLRTNVSGDPTFLELLNRVKEVCLGAYAHQDVPFEKLVEELQPERSLNHSPLFQVVFVLQNAPVGALELPGLVLSPIERERDEAQFDLTLDMQEAEGKLYGTLGYNTDLFEAETIKRMLGHFETLLAAVVADPAQPLSTLPLLTEAEEQQLAAWNHTTREYPRDACIHQLFEAQVERTPEAVAVSFGAQEISYRELNRRANQLAHYLRSMGVGPEVCVGVCLERSVDLIVALVAILKAGGAYVPLDPSYPLERLSLMLEDAQIGILVTTEKMLSAHSVQVVCLDRDAEMIASLSEENLGSAVSAENLAYVMYTSGSTGQPKGVSVVHRSVVRLVKETNYVDVCERDVFLQSAPISFDASTFEVWGSLLNGARLVLLEQQRPTLEELARAIDSHRVTVLWLTAGLFHLMVDEQASALLGVRRLLAGGDVLAVEQVSKYLAQMGAEQRLINGYGPTENTTFTCCHTMTRESRWEGTVPIGKPIANTTVYILDQQQRPVPVGVYGEIYAGGDGLARGYLHGPELTAEKFVPHPFSARAGERLYRIGDVGRWLNDGSIEYLGRVDHQVKLRGFRIELGEIEAVLSRHEAVREAVVVVQTVNHDKRLVAYVVAEESLQSGELRQYLKGVLPEYMAPQVFVQMERLPLTANGKVDRRALPAVEHVREETEMVEAQTPVEEVLVGIWSEVLGARVGAEDDFFALGGHSLLATQVMSRVRAAFSVEIALRELFERPTVKELGQSIERELRQGAGVSAPPIERRERVEELPLSFAQQRLWFIDQLAPGGTVYNSPLAVRLSGALNVLALEQTVNEIIRRHEVLRTSFAVVEKQPVQVIAAAVSLSLSVQELTSLPEAEREAEVMRLVEAEAHQPFDLSQGPLLRVKLWRLSESDHVVLLTMHHIITDGWSLGVLINEVAALYRAFAQGEPASLPELPVQYADFAIWQRERLQGEELERQLGYWRQQLAEAPALLELPTDRPRPPLQTFNGADEAFMLSAETTQALQRLSRSKDVTLFMTLLAVWQVLLHRYSGQKDVVVGTSMANRNRAETEGLIGFFVNMLVLRTSVAGDPTFFELLNRVKEVCLGAYAHQDVPFEKLVEELQPERSLNHSPLFQVVLTLQNAPMGALELPGLVLSPIEQQRDETQFDLVFDLQEAEGQLYGTLHYNTDLFEAETIKRLLGHYQRLLAAVVADPAQQLATLPLLTEAEEQQLAAWNHTSREYPRDACIHQLFEAQVERTPEAVAVSFKAQRLSYRELNQRANQLAHHLQKLGLEPGARVGLYLAHSPETLVAILGVLKAGAAYVPIDPDHPIGRLHFILEDAEIAVLLTETGLAERVATLPDTRLLCLDSDWEAIASESGQNPAPRASAADLAYVIYTSGSTGTPKGVKIQQRALVNYIWWAKDVYVQDEQLDFPLYSSLAFDLTVTSIFTPLLTGNRVVVYRPDGWQSPLTEILKDDQVGVLKLTPSHLALLKDGDNSQSHIKRLIVGGEAFKSELARQVYESFGGQVEIYNEYGPTEATVGCMIYRFNPAQVELASVPIGRPAANVQIYILDEQLSPVPENVVGEVYIAGDGLAAGYLNRADLTAESFICNPFLPAQRMYRTKDLARRLPDQEIEYVGRQDEQVKFHGYRVELNEIRSVLNSYRGVRDSVVLVRKKPGHGNDLMIAYYAARQEIEARVLRDFLAQSLIKETIPNVFVHLKKLPLTLNGKVNLKALPDLEETRLATKHQYQGTRTPIEAALATIWEEILSVRQIGLDANFFELGGHSLLVTQVISRVREAFGVEVGLRELFERPTVKELGQSIERALRQGAGVSTPPIERRERVGELPLSFAQQRLWFIDQLEPGSAVYNVPVAVRLKGRLNQEALAQTLSEVIRRHEVLRTRFGTVGGRAVQVIEAAAPIELEVVELSALEVAEREARVRELAAQEAATPFDLSRGPLLRVKLLRLGEQEHVVLLTMHHIVIDAWSLGIFIREIATLYEAFLEGRPSPLPELAIQYADFALWQRAYLQGEVLEQQLKYWREQLAGAETVLKLPTDKPRPEIYSYRGATHKFVLPTAVTAPLRKLSQEQGCTLFMTLLASFKTLLYRYTEQEDILVGTAIANRNRSETEALIGFFVNTLVLRTDLSGNPSFRQLMQRVRETTLGAYVHQDMPFEKLVEELQPERSLSQAPLFQVAFGVQNTPSQTLALPGLELSPMGFDFDTGRFDLTLWISEYEDELSGVWYYNTDLFEAATIKRMQGHFETVLQNVLAQPDLPLREIEMLTEDEKKQRIVQKRERLDSNAQVLRTIRRKGISVPQATAAQTELN